jgi:hypothetical protein
VPGTSWRYQLDHLRAQAGGGECGIVMHASGRWATYRFEHRTRNRRVTTSSLVLRCPLLGKARPAALHQHQADLPGTGWVHRTWTRLLLASPTRFIRRIGTRNAGAFIRSST